MRTPAFARLLLVLGVACVLPTWSLSFNRVNKLKPSAVVNYNNRGGKAKNLLEKYILSDEFSANILKQQVGVRTSQVLYELKSSEELLKNLLFKVLNHLYEYVRYRLISSFYNFYIVTPFNFKLTNLLNTELNNYYLTNKLNLPTYATPALYGLDYQNVGAADAQVNVEGSGNSWFIRSSDKNCDKAFVLMHGWFGNLQSTLPFLNILNQSGVLRDHHVLILNTNPGDDNNFLANIGLAGVRTLYHGLEFLHKQFNVKRVSLYGQSINSVSILALCDYMDGLGGGPGRAAPEGPGEDALSADQAREENPLFKTMFNGFDAKMLSELTVERVVLESPVVTVGAHVRHFGQFLMLLGSSMSGLNVNIKWVPTTLSWEKYLNLLNILNYLKAPRLRRRVFLLQGANDSITSVEILRNELKNHSFMPHLFLFRNSGHIDLSVADYADYRRAVEYALGHGSFLNLFRFNRNKVKSLGQLP